jgi:hypothetical protein
LGENDLQGDTSRHRVVFESIQQGGKNFVAFCPARSLPPLRSLDQLVPILESQAGILSTPNAQAALHVP